ncbi:inositol phosphate phosphatase SopB [Succinimonas amylolytica]|uniref:inositol phosphate phosphatase SopB n=1 Tax=Succinimonas amylolytica TaxID=83769 RepID=UPI0023A8BCE1
MTIEIHVDHVLQDVFDNMNTLRASNDSKIKITAQGELASDNRHRFRILTGVNTVAADTRTSINTLRNALSRTFNDNTANQILDKYLTAEQRAGTQRLTLKDLRAIRHSVEIRKTVQILREKFQQHVNENPDQYRAEVAQQKASGQRLQNVSLKLDPSDEQMREIVDVNTKKSVQLLVALKNRLPHDVQTASATDMAKNQTLLETARMVSDNCRNALKELDILKRDNPNNPGLDRVCNPLRQQFLQMKVKADRLKINIEGILNHKADLVRNFRDSYTDRIETGIAIINKINSKIQTLNNDTRFQAMQNLNNLAVALAGKRDSMQARNDFDIVSTNDFEYFAHFASKLSKKLKECIPGTIRTALSTVPDAPGLGKKDIKSIIDKSMAASGKWDIIEKELPLHINDKYNKTFKFKLIPLNKIPNVKVSQDFQDQDIRGRSVNNYTSGNRTVSHITNLIKTETRDGNGSLLFSGYRHGTTAAFEVPENRNVPENEKFRDREAATLARTKELVRTMVEDKYLGELNQNRGTRQNPIEISISAISLLTPSSMIDKGEEEMFRLQCQAWERVSGNEPLELTVKVPDPHNPANSVPRTVYVRPRVNIFNYPCQWQSINLNMGWRRSEERNSGSLNNMIGNEFMNNDVKLEDITANRAERLNTAFTRMNDDQNSQLGRFLRDNNIPEDKKKIARILALEINLLTRKQPLLLTSNMVQKQHNIDAYALPARIALLNSILGNETCFNCKSGKDRTGQLDAEIRTLAANMSEVTPQTDIVAYMNKNSDVIDVLRNGTYTSMQQQNNMTSVAINSGIMEVHELNTGLMGSKLKGSTGVINIGGGVPHQFNTAAFGFYQGASSHAKS